MAKTTVALKKNINNRSAMSGVHVKWSLYLYLGLKEPIIENTDIIIAIILNYKHII